MKEIKFIKIFVMLFLFTCLFSYAYQVGRDYAEHFWTGNGFLEVMRDESNPMRLIPLGYIVGIDDALNNIHWEHSDKVTPRQLVDIVKNYLEENPGVRHEPIYILVLNAFSEEFPEPETPWLIPNPDWIEKNKKK